MEVDILIVGDFRFPGGTSTSIISEVKALHSAGYRVGLLSVSSCILPNTRTFHPGIRALASEGQASFIPPGIQVSARLCCLHHPVIFEKLPAIPLEIDCPRFVLVVHHPPVDATGEAQYDVASIARITEELFGKVEWAPVGPKVRAAFASVKPCPAILLQEDWYNIIDAAEYPVAQSKLPKALPVIGRHSRPEAEKWPDNAQTFLEAYPDAPDVRVRLMGWSAALDDVVDQRPHNWDVLSFGAMPVSDFLGTLEYFSYFHSDDWVEAFGRSILEAMSVGLVCFLPEHFRTLFQDAAIYCKPAEVLSHVRRLENDRAAYRAQSDRARRFVQSNFGPHKAVERVRAIIGPAQQTAVPANPIRPASVLYLTTNGVGMGHIARCLASARRLSDACKPVIVTMSKAFDVAKTQGIDIEYIPFFRSIGLEHDHWVGKVMAELDLILRYHRPEVFVFDGNVPYDGLIATLPNYPAMWKVWQRRPLWPPDVGRHSLAHAGIFDVVLEPGELAAPVDRGLTVKRQFEACKVPNIRFLDKSEALDRKSARRMLGLDPSKPALLMQLGAGNNIDLASVIEMICEAADPKSNARPMQLVFARWRISENENELPDFVRVLDAFPIARFLNAFDCAVAMAGYNSFHENIAAGLPTMFIANTHPEQDEQWLRADYAAMKGLALSAKADDPINFRRELRRLLDPKTRDRLRNACGALAMPNGAQETAEFIEALAMSRKTSELEFRPGRTAGAIAR